MSSRTTNLNLYKPDRTEYVSVITDLNNNWDIVDQAFGDLHDSSVNVSEAQSFTDAEKAQALSNLGMNVIDISNSVLIECARGSVTEKKIYRQGNVVTFYIKVEVEGQVQAGDALTCAVNFYPLNYFQPLVQYSINEEDPGFLQNSPPDYYFTQYTTNYGVFIAKSANGSMNGASANFRGTALCGFV